MSAGFNDDAKEQIRHAVDIVELVGEHVQLQKKGRMFLGLCPWHEDNRPSLQVNPDRQSWKCWVCDIGGDVFSFAMRQEGLEFREALELLAEAGWHRSPTTGVLIREGSEFRLTIRTDNDPTRVALAGEIARQLEPLGIRATVASTSVEPASVRSV